MPSRRKYIDIHESQQHFIFIKIKIVQVNCRKTCAIVVDISMTKNEPFSAKWQQPSIIFITNIILRRKVKERILGLEFLEKTEFFIIFVYIWYMNLKCVIHRVPRHYIWFLKYYFDYNESDCINVVNILFAEGVE